MSATGREALRLYRAILRRGNSLTYTDKDFFKRTVRKEFRRWSREKNPEEIKQQLKVSMSTYTKV